MQRTEAVEITSYLIAEPRLATGAGVRVSRIAGLVCWTMAATKDGFLNRAVGFGTMSDATPSVLDRLERRFASAERSPRLALATGSVPRAAIRLLERRGYAPEAGTEEQIYGYTRSRAPTAFDVDGLAIERVRPEQAAPYAKAASASFTERGPMFRTMLEALIRRRGGGRALNAYLGHLDGTPAATGILFDARPVGGLGNGSVLPAFRGRGIQKAMLAHRIRVGWARGLRIFIAETQNPVSARNMEEVGFRLLYTEIDWVRADPT